MRRVILESPFAGDIETNIRYARACLKDCLKRGEAPYASHLLYTQEGVLDDTVPEERMWGIHAGFEWNKVAEASIVYTDLGISKGMEYGIKHANECHRPIEFRSLIEWNKYPNIDFRYSINEKVRIISYTGINIPGIVIACWVPDRNEHVAGPHNRYKILTAYKIDDVSEIELEELECSHH